MKMYHTGLSPSKTKMRVAESCVSCGVKLKSTLIDYDFDDHLGPNESEIRRRLSKKL